MSNANPLIPQGSLLEQQAKSKPHLRIALCIVAVHLIFLGGLLMQGCGKPETTATDSAKLPEFPPLATNETTGFAAGGTGAVPAPDFGAGMLPPAGGAITGAPPSGLPPAGGAAYAPPGAGQVPPAGGYVPPAVPDLSPAAPATQEYTVVRGDSFYSIGRKFGVSATAISKANPGVDSTRLRIGQKLQIPAATTPAPAAVPLGGGSGSAGGTETYTVKAGDTLLKISRAHGTTVAAIRELNGLRTDRINVGQKLKIPAKAAPPAESVVPVPATSGPAAPFAPTGTSPQ